ncbi:MAG: TetR/AcrR family transcriptional regulator, partial [Chloroflexota bacterium]|nr:TetR/AcrR family transcriptional regulator [Chloroflexota bacterium]
LFYERGIQTTGVEAIINAAGVAKATFYRHFPSKDDLVVAWLRDRPTRWFERVEAAVEALDAEPAEKIPLFFDGVADWLETEGFRGCPYLNTGAEITEPTHPARLIAREALKEVEDYLHDLVSAAGYREPRTLAAALQTLLAGSISLGVARRSRASVKTARDAAASLLSRAERD